MNGFKASSLTAQDAISYLQAMMLADGIANLPTGNLSNTDQTVLTGVAQDLENYHGDKLADDGEQYYHSTFAFFGGAIDRAARTGVAAAEMSATA
jgi:hypothetical protein